MCSTTDDRRDAGLNGGAPKHPKRKLIATIRERPITCDDCCHTIWYRVYKTATGLEIDYCHRTVYGPPWATPEERKPYFERSRFKGSENLEPLYEEIMHTPLLPISPSGDYDCDYGSTTVKVGNELSSVTYCWQFRSPPKEWGVLNRFVQAVVDSMSEDMVSGSNPIDIQLDELVEKAKDVIRRTKRASAAHFQRHLCWGYKRASKVVDELERRGIIGPASGPNSREVFMDKLW